ncbi:MAG: putative oxidoreductase C-terminal domain-containing protein, partial [Minisyncoccia bacterium]
AKHWTTDMTLNEFKTITKLDSFPAYFKNIIVKDTVLPIFCNGSIDYTLRGVHARITVKWDYKAPDGSGDTHYSMLHGTKANLVIRQGPEQQYKPTLYIEPVTKDGSYTKGLDEQMKTINAKYPGVSLKKINAGWEVVIPDKYKDGHEAHFAQVTKNFLEYLQKGDMPSWEVPNMLAKYYTTTKALELARKQK